MRLLLALLLLAPATPTPPAVGVSVGVAHADPVAERVVGSRNSNVYHRPSCRHAARILPSNLVTYASEAAAQADGRRACRVCRPG